MHRRLVLVIVAILPVALHAQDPTVGSWRGFWTRAADTLFVTLDIQPGDSAHRYRVSFYSDRVRVTGIPFSSTDVRPRNAEGYLDDLVAWLRGASGLDRRDSAQGARLITSCSRGA